MDLMRPLQELLESCDLKYSAATFALRTAGLGAGFGLGAAMAVFNYDAVLALQLFLSVFFLFEAGVYSLLLDAANRRIALMEAALPEFLSMMASHISSGVTYDRALLLSARKEFGPLTRHIDLAAKETLAGKPLGRALSDMASRTHSSLMIRTFRLVVEGINSGGNLGALLEQTALDIRRFSIVRKEVASVVLAYKLFLLAAAAVGAPLLYAVSGFLIRIISQTRAHVSAQALEQAGASLPFLGSSSGFSTNTVFWFSILAIAATAILSSLAGGVISKGKESEGLPTIPLMLAASYGVFFLTGLLLQYLVAGIFPSG